MIAPVGLEGGEMSEFRARFGELGPFVSKC